MNERIKELRKQAVQPHTGDSWAEQTAFMEEFAELLVRECARIVINNGIATATHDQMVRQDCVNDIKRHFGVKE